MRRSALPRLTRVAPEPRGAGLSQTLPIPRLNEAIERVRRREVSTALVLESPDVNSAQ
jgi:hypothetical protein